MSTVALGMQMTKLYDDLRIMLIDIRERLKRIEYNKDKKLK